MSVMRVVMLVGLAILIALPAVGAALGHIPAVGAQLTAICGNLGLGIAGAAASMLAMFLYDLVMDGVMGLTGGSTGRATATA